MEYLKHQTRIREDKNGCPTQVILRYREDSKQAWKQASKYIYTANKKSDIKKWREENKTIFNSTNRDEIDKCMRENRPIYAPNKTEADKAINEWCDWFKSEKEMAIKQAQKEALEKELKNLPNKASITDYMAQYITMLEKTKVIEPSTVKGYRTILGIISKNLAPIPLDELKPSHVQKLESDLLEQGKSLSTVGKVHRLLKTVCKHAVNVDDLSKNPIDAVKSPKRPTVKPNALDSNSMSKLVQYLETAETTPTITGIGLAVFAGLRAGECCALKWRDVDLENAQIHINGSIGVGNGGAYVKDPKNESSRRVVDIPEQLVKLLDQRKQVMQSQCSELGLKLGKDMYVLSHDLTNYHEPNRLSKNWSVIAESLGLHGTHELKVKFHDLRHSYATYAILNGIDVVTVASQMGHNSPKMTLDIYSSDSPEAKKAAAKKLTEVYKQQSRVIPFKQAGNE